MDTQLICTTGRELHALGLSGQQVMGAYDQITRYLRGVTSPQHAALFCEPSIGKDAADWYGPAGQPFQSLGALTPEARAPIEETLRTRIFAIRDHAEELQRSAKQDDRLMGDLLMLAIELPSTDYIYAVGSEPILAGWGNHLEGPEAPAGVLLKHLSVMPRSETAGVFGRAVKAEAAAGTEAVIRPARSLGWLWWALATLLLVLSLLSLAFWQRPRLLALAHLPTPNPNCQISPGELNALAALDRERARGHALRQQLADLRSSVAARRAKCPVDRHYDVPAPDH